jgi:hypothetical protein
VDESLKQASAFHDAHAINPQKEVRPNVVYEHEKMKEQEIKK